MLLIVMFETGTWRVSSTQRCTFGRAPTCDVVLPNDDRGVSRNAGSFDFQHGTWWLTNASASSMLYVTGDLGFRADLPPGMRLPLQQWHAKVRLDGVITSYTLRLRLPDLDEDTDIGQVGEDPAESAPQRIVTSPERIVTSTKLRAPLNASDRLGSARRGEAMREHPEPVPSHRRTWPARTARPGGTRRAAHLNGRADLRRSAPAAGGPAAESLT